MLMGGGGRADPGMGEVKGCQIPPYWDAEGRRRKIVSLLRYRNTVSPIPTGFKTRSGRTLLSFAVENGKHLVVSYKYNRATDGTGRCQPEHTG